MLQGPLLGPMYNSPDGIAEGDTEPQSPVLVHSENEMIDSSKPFIACAPAEPFAIQSHPTFNLMSPSPPRQEDEVLQVTTSPGTLKFGSITKVPAKSMFKYH